MEKRKFVQIPVNGPIAELGFITGPVGPTYVNLSSVIKMVQNGKLIYEVDPANHAHKVKLDITNVKKNNIAEPVKFEKPIATDSEPTPVVEEVKEVEKTPEPEKVETVEEEVKPEEVVEETKADDVVNEEVTTPEEKKDEKKETANNIVKQYNAQKQNNYKNKKKK